MGPWFFLLLGGVAVVKVVECSCCLVKTTRLVDRAVL